MNFKELFTVRRKNHSSFGLEKDLTLLTNLLLQVLVLDVMMEVVGLAVAKPQINVERAKETVIRIPTAKLI